MKGIIHLGKNLSREYTSRPNLSLPEKHVFLTENIEGGLPG
jgi:hypothetical protein